MFYLVGSFDELEDNSSENSVPDEQDRQPDSREEKRDETLEAVNTFPNSIQSLFAFLCCLCHILQGGSDHRLPSDPPTLSLAHLCRCGVEIQGHAITRSIKLSAFDLHSTVTVGTGGLLKAVEGQTDVQTAIKRRVRCWSVVGRLSHDQRR